MLIVIYSKLLGRVYFTVSPGNVMMGNIQGNGKIRGSG